MNHSSSHDAADHNRSLLLEGQKPPANDISDLQRDLERELRNAFARGVRVGMLQERVRLAKLGVDLHLEDEL